MNRVYEELFIVRPDATEEEVDGIVEPIRGVVTNAGGTVDKLEKWGVRRLAYKVEKRNEGYYVLMQFTSGAPAVVREVERRLRVNDAVMKFITVRIDEKLKKVEKRRKAREKRAARRPAPVAAPAVPAEAAAPVPGAPIPGAPAPGAPESRRERAERPRPVEE
ncbi:MAG TPA: 30S ribosomal protein S6 [Bryobacteraceae bacterium]|nr:30S ribosomal protein S6 [Bryobacteraceae bacterium]